MSGLCKIVKKEYRFDLKSLLLKNCLVFDLLFDFDADNDFGANVFLANFSTIMADLSGLKDMHIRE